MPCIAFLVHGVYNLLLTDKTPVRACMGLWRDDMRYKEAYNYFISRTDGMGIDPSALGCAVLAIEKQIPMQVKKDHADTVCPSCKGSLFNEDLNVIEESNYCYQCGQRLKWYGR